MSKIFKCLALACLAALVSACGHAPQRQDGAHRAADVNTVSWIEWSRHNVWARMRAVSPGDPVSSALLKACGEGKSVELLLWAGSEVQASFLSGSCVRVWVTAHPDVASQPTTLLLDSSALVIDGNLESYDSRKAAREYQAQAGVKHLQARRIN